jgi:hypothetical protein
MKTVLTHRYRSPAVILTASLSFMVWTVPAPIQTDPPVNHARPYEPIVKPAFLPLPPSAVEPSGWLRDWAEAARRQPA